MSVAENIAFGLKIKKKSQSYISDKIKYAAKLVNLEGFEKRSPATSRRSAAAIAIARAIVNEPRVLLPGRTFERSILSSGGHATELIRLKNELGITFVYVTHDQQESSDNVGYHSRHEPGLYPADRISRTYL